MHDSQSKSQRRGTSSHRKYDPLCAHLAFRQILIPVAVYFLQTTPKLLDRDRLELSVLDQARDFPQERRELSPVVVVETESSKVDAVGGEYDCDCEERGVVRQLGGSDMRCGTNM